MVSPSHCLMSCHLHRLHSRNPYLLGFLQRSSIYVLRNSELLMYHHPPSASTPARSLKPLPRSLLMTSRRGRNMHKDHNQNLSPVLFVVWSNSSVNGLFYMISFQLTCFCVSNILSSEFRVACKALMAYGEPMLGQRNHLVLLDLNHIRFNELDIYLVSPFCPFPALLVGGEGGAIRRPCGFGFKRLHCSIGQ